MANRTQGAHSTSLAPDVQGPQSITGRPETPRRAVRGSALLLLIIILVAFTLRAWNLTGIPPGLTHDEANHGREAIGILKGVFLYFFPLNYGSEPLYSYTVALFMALIGRGLLALRLVNVIFGTAAVAMTTVWAAPRLGRATALLGAALMAVSFWPLAASREALRAGMLPFFMALAVWAFWRILEITNYELRITSEEEGPSGRQINDGAKFAIRRALFVILFGLAVALTLHIYLAARVSWLLFPVFLGYLALIERETFRRVWRPVLAGLLLAGALVAPMFLYLRAHPEMQTRLDMLDRPLQDIAAGNLGPILLNIRDALLAFVWPGFGDGFLAYNIPGRPVLDVISAIFFVLGIVICLWRWRRPAYGFLILWFLIGIIPSLVTGPTANTTRNMAALPAVYLIAAVGAVAPFARLVGNRGRRRNEGHIPWSVVCGPLSVLLVTWVAFVSGHDYFIRWGQSAEVRGAYQNTLVRALEHLEARYPDAGPFLFSSVYPGPAHDSSITLVLGADRPAVGETARWVDARHALVLPPDETLAVIPASTSPHPFFMPWLEAIETVEMRPDDLDPAFTVYRMDGAKAIDSLTDAGAVAQPIDFNGAIELEAARWLREDARPGETAELMTVWRVLDPTRAGPVAPPSFTTDAVLFTHVLDESGAILTQYDGLDAPSWAWRAGDRIVQIHPLVVPESAVSGEYAAITGFYDRTSGARLPVTTGGETTPVPRLTVAQP